jgi:uncharacterized protein (TIGR00661 family)
MNFFTAPLKAHKAVLANPVIRRQVIEQKIERHQHITVYSNNSKPEIRAKLISVFSRFPSHHFYIYGFQNEEEHGNCVFKKISTDGFLRDLATCSGVVATAGMSLLSECLYLKKRMYLTPLKGQFEQQVNAVYADRLGVALHAEDIEESKLKLFFNALDKDYSTDSRILWPDNEAYFGVLDQTLQKIGFDLKLTANTQERF